MARGIDERPVKAFSKRKSIGKETTFDSNVTNKASIWQTLLGIVERLKSTLSDKKMMARTITLKVKYSDFQLNTRSKTDTNGFISKDQMAAALPELLRKTEVGSRPIRLIGITLANLYQIDEVSDSSIVSETQEDPQLGLF